jgi:hypothetical protein
MGTWKDRKNMYPGEVLLFSTSLPLLAVENRGILAAVFIAALLASPRLSIEIAAQ